MKYFIKKLLDSIDRNVQVNQKRKVHKNGTTYTIQERAKMSVFNIPKKPIQYHTLQARHFRRVFQEPVEI